MPLLLGEMLLPVDKELAEIHRFNTHKNPHCVFLTVNCNKTQQMDICFEGYLWFEEKVSFGSNK